MIRIRRGIVTSLGSARPGAQELEVEVEGSQARALAYTDLVGPISLGDHVLLNTTAVSMDLGSGGLHFVMAVEGKEPGADAAGRTMKLRYTPSQVAVSTVEERYGDILDRSRGLSDTPVVVAPLHSMIGPVSAGAKRAGGDHTHVAYVMTDGASLSGPLSRLVDELKRAGLIDSWFTSGQAFGGEYEAITVWSAMLAAVEIAGADVIVVSDGPGNVGSATTWGVSALAGGNAINAAHRLGGRPLPALRISFADPRDRHRGVSHHSITILRDVCYVDVDVPVPTIEDEQRRRVVWDELREARLEERHKLVEVDGAPAMQELWDREMAITSMGRSYDDDPFFFLAAGAAGVLAGRMASANQRWRTTASGP